MKIVTAVSILLVMLSYTVAAQENKTNAPAKIAAAQAKEHIGTERIVTGKIVEVNKAEKLVRLNLEKPFPSQPFTAVIFATRTNLFEDLDKLKGKNVELTGKISDYNGRPQIILTSTNQLRVVEEEMKEERSRAK